MASSKQWPKQKEIVFKYPDWLEKLTIQSAARYGYPLDTIEKELKAIGSSGEADPYRTSSKRKEVMRDDDEDAEMEAGVVEYGEVLEPESMPKVKRRKGTVVDLSQPTQDEVVERMVGSTVAEASMNEAAEAGAAKLDLTNPFVTKPSKAAAKPSSTKPVVTRPSKAGTKQYLVKHTVAESSKNRAAKRDLRKVAVPNSQKPESLFVPEERSLSPKSNDYVPLPLPIWYQKITSNSHGFKELKKRPSSSQSDTLTSLSSMKGCIKRCEDDPKPEPFEDLRDQIHKAEILLKVDRYIVRFKQMLSIDNGLPRIFASNKIDFPWDLRADAWQLYNRWYAEIFEVDLLRGITQKGEHRNADSIDPGWPGRVKANYYGAGTLVLGQWWPTQLSAVRDGAHGAAQAGIFGEKGRGAYSVVLSGGSYDDEDCGTSIWYSGTEGKDCTPTENTARLIESCDITGHNQVRVLRSHQLPKSNPFRPEVGLRYDGLYEVVEKKLVNMQKASYKFKLERCKGQHPIRCENNAARRPTIYEVKADAALRKSGRC